MERIPVAGPWITDLEIDYVNQAVRYAWYDRANEPIQLFEDAFASYVSRGHAVSLPSCTAGLHLALSALGIGPGDEVIVPDLTWIATSAPVSYVGATPVFADVDSSTLCLTSETVEACITPRTKAVIVVDLYGVIPDLTALENLAARHGIALIEDAAEAIGSERDGRRAGNFGIASVFSFHGSKTMTTGEGGMLVTDDDRLIERIQFLRDHGRDRGDRAFNNSEVAFKYKMTALQAALGRAQLERVEELLERKRQIYGWYAERLRSAAGIALMASEGEKGIVWWMVTIQLDPSLGWDKDQLQSALAHEGIDTRPGFRPLSSLPAYADSPQSSAARSRNATAYAIDRYYLNLPSAMSLTEEDVDRVCTALANALSMPWSSSDADD